MKKRKLFSMLLITSGILLALSVLAHFEAIRIPGVSDNLLMFFSLLISFPGVVYMVFKKSS